MMIRIDELPEQSQALAEPQYVELSWLERSRPRIRCQTDKGLQLALALPRGTILADRDLLFNTSGLCIIVKAKVEPVMLIQAKNANELCLVAHQLGNWHRALQLEDENSILTEPDSVLEEWLSNSGISHRIELRPYHPNMRELQHKISILI